MVRTIDQQFELLWDEFRLDLSKFVRSKVHNEHDAEDILQEVFIKIYKNLETLEKKTAIKSWIFTITKNSIIDYYKKKKDIIMTPEKMLTIEDENFEENNMNDEISECLKHMIFDLPQKYQNVYDLYENKNMKHKDIVEALDISLSTSKVRLMRAKELFKKNLVECCDFEVDNYGNVINYKRKGEGCKRCSTNPNDSKC